MITPPDNPATKRQKKNHGKDSGSAHAKKAAVASSIMPRSTLAAGNRAASGEATSAPARYPARLAAPR